MDFTAHVQHARDTVHRQQGTEPDVCSFRDFSYLKKGGNKGFSGVFNAHWVLQAVGSRAGGSFRSRFIIFQVLQDLRL